MATRVDILTSIEGGRKIGLSRDDRLVINQDSGTQFVIGPDNTLTAAEAAAVAANGASVVSHGVALIAGFGDSITARAVTASSTVVAYNGDGFLSWVQALSMGKLWMPLVCKIEPSAVITTLVSYCKGVSGETTADMLLRTSDITNLNPRPKHVFLLAGTNDLAASATIADSAATVFTRWSTIVQRFLDVGIIVVCYTILPRGSMASGASGSRPGWSTLTDAQISTAKGKMTQINNMIRAFCARTPGTILVDPWRRLVDYATSGDAVSTLTAAGDFIHPNDLGAYYIGDETRLAMAPYLSQTEVLDFAGAGDVYSATDNPFGSMFDGSYITGTGGTATAPVTAGAGGVPTDWTHNRLSGAGSSTATIQKRVRSDGKNGYECHAVFTGGAGGPDVFRGYKGGSTVASTSFAAGDAWYAQQDVAVSATTGAYAPPDLNCRQNTANIYALKKGSVDVPGTYSVRLRTPLIVQPATPVNLNCWTLDTIGTVCSADVSRRDLSLRRYNTALLGAVPIV